MPIRSSLLASLLLALGLANPALAETGAAESSSAAFDTDQADFVPLAEAPALLKRLQDEEIALLHIRAAYPAYFAEAYARHPQIPQGVLEAIAYSQTRWLPPQPGAGGHKHHHMPSAHGLMGLYGGEGFTDQLAQAEALTGFKAADIARDDRLNVLAAAALLAHEIDTEPGIKAGSTPSLEAMAPILVRYAGFTPMSDDKSPIDDFARHSFAFDVLLTLDRGINEKGVFVPEQPVQWEQAFSSDKLVLLQAPFMRLDLSKDQIEVADYAIDPITQTLADTAPDATDKAEKSTDYGPAIWNPAHSSNYTHSRSSAISAVTVHTVQGSYASAIS